MNENPTINLTGEALPEPTEQVRSAGEALRTAFEEACRSEKLLGHLTGPPDCMDLSFETQDTAPPELILKTFLEELEKRGVKAGPVLRPHPALGEAEIRTAAAALADTVRRIRALLVEYNSYLSAGLPFVFDASSALMKDRGLCIYRYPARAGTEVRIESEAVRITFHAGSLGEVTSSGFYVPTRVRGDITAEIRYRLRQWKPGPDNACLALFAQDEASMVRFYAQRYTLAEAPAGPLLLANLNDRRTEAGPVAGDEGAFRLIRRGTTISAWHRSGNEKWRMLGESPFEDAPDLYIGAKIWSGVECSGLEADLSNLRIEGEVPEDQTTVPVERPDPRDA